MLNRAIDVDTVVFKAKMRTPLNQLRQECSDKSNQLTHRCQCSDYSSIAWEQWCFSTAFSLKKNTATTFVKKWFHKSRNEIYQYLLSFEYRCLR